MYRLRLPGRVGKAIVKNCCADAVIDYEEEGSVTTTAMQFYVIDQAQLVGVVNAVYNMGYGIISLERVGDLSEVGSDQ